MPSFKDSVRAVQRGEKPFVVRHHAKWISKPESERAYSPEAIQFVADALAGKYKIPRKGRFSASGLGQCPRKQVLSFAGAPEAGEDPESHDIKALGTWGHLRWQAEGLTVPYMQAAEVFVFDPKTNFGGSIDAVLLDGSPFELKTVSTGKYSVAMRNGKPFEDHEMQFDGYCEEMGVDTGSVVYETRDFGEFFEFRWTRREEIARKRSDLLEELNNHVADDTLPPMLGAPGSVVDGKRRGENDQLVQCAAGAGPIVKDCQFRLICPTVASVKGVRQLKLVA